MNWAVELIKFFRELIINGRSFLASVILMSFCMGMVGWQGKAYVDLKHKNGIKEVEKNQKQIREIQRTQQDVVTTLQVMQATLKNVDSAMIEVKGSVKDTGKAVQDTQKEVLKIYRSVYQIKMNQATNGG